MAMLNRGNLPVLTAQAKEATAAVGGMASNLNRAILPALGLTAAFSVLGGGLSNNTLGAHQMSAATWRLRTSMWDLQDTLTQLVLPVVEELTPLIASGVEKFTDLDASTQRWILGAGLGTAAAIKFNAQIRWLAFTGIPALLAAGGGMGAGVVSSGLYSGVHEWVARWLEREHGLNLDDFSGGSIVGPGLGPAEDVLERQLHRAFEAAGLPRFREPQTSAGDGGGSPSTVFPITMPAPVVRPTGAEYAGAVDTAPVRERAVQRGDTYINIYSYDDRDMWEKIQQGIDVGAINLGGANP